MNDVRVHPHNYIFPKKTFVEKYMPQLSQIYERRQPKPVATGPKKVVIFDLDETIGSFGDLSFLWKTLHSDTGYSDSGESKRRFHDILRLYPEFFRPGIFTVFEYIYRKIQRGTAFPIHVYTNNQCEAPNWVAMILSFIENRVVVTKSDQICSGLFADPICAFKIGGKKVNLKRTTHHKTPADFVRCSLVPRNAEICFMDDQTHEHMKTGKVYYIQPPAYYHPLSREEIMDRFSKSNIYSLYFNKKMIPIEIHSTTTSMSSKKEYDERIGKQIMYFVREFFLVNLPPAQSTRRRHSYKRNYTRNRNR